MHRGKLPTPKTLWEKEKPSVNRLTPYTAPMPSSPHTVAPVPMTGLLEWHYQQADL